MRSKKASLHPLLIILAVALASVLFVVACGGGNEATAVPQAVEEAEVSDQGEVAQAPEVVEEAEVAAQPGEPKRGGSLTVAFKANQATLDPALLITFPDIAIHQAAYDNLLMIQPDLSLKPELATSWEPNDDLSSYTFHLRQGVKFHHGKDFKAEDVVFTFNRLLDPVLDSPGADHFQFNRRDGHPRRPHGPLRPHQPQPVLPGVSFDLFCPDHPRRRRCGPADSGGVWHGALHH